MFGANVGPLELIVVLVIVLVIFGPKRLPQLGRQLGRGMKEFKDSITGDSKDDDEDEPRGLGTTTTATTSSGTATHTEGDREPARAPADQPKV